jgi:hypothetical protein
VPCISLAHIEGCLWHASLDGHGGRLVLASHADQELRAHAYSVPALDAALAVPVL